MSDSFNSPVLDLFYGLDAGLFLFLAIQTARDYFRSFHRTRLVITLLLGSVGMGTLFAVKPIWVLTNGWSTTAALLFMFTKPIVTIYTVEQFISLPSWVKPAAWLAQIITWGAIIAWAPRGSLSANDFPLLVVMATTLYYIPTHFSMIVAFWRKQKGAPGMTHERLRLAIIGALGYFLAYEFEFGATAAGYPEIGRVGLVVFLIVCALGYYAGFVPPRWLRQSWEATEVKVFLKRITNHPQGLSTRDLMELLRISAERALGAERVIAAGFDDNLQNLEFMPDVRNVFHGPIDINSGVTGHAWRTGTMANGPHPIALGIQEAQLMHSLGAATLTAVPLATGGRKFGVLLVFMHSEPLFPDDHGQILSALAEQVQLVEALNHTSRTLSWYTRCISHELTNHIAVIKPKLESLLANPGVTLQADVDVVGRRLALVVGLSDELAALAALEAPESSWEVREVDLADCVREVVNHMVPILEAAGFYLETDIPDSVVVNTVPGKVDLVVRNLVENAIKYAEEGRWLGVRVLELNEYVRIEVEDRGPGIDPLDHSLIFVPYYRAGRNNEKVKPGLGMGLAIIANIIERLGGTVGVFTPREGGACFWLQVPRTR